MDQRNFEYLKNQLKYTGFTEQLSEQLLSSMQRRLPAFSLQYRTHFGRDQLSASLNFQRSAGSEMYFFNSYLASLKNQDQSQKVNQLFYIRPSGSITLKEAFNLLQGRAVEKQFINRQGEPYRAWVQLDFKNTDLDGNFKIRQFHQNYGYDLSEQVSKLSLKELGDDLSKSRLLESLRRGNRQQVTLLDQGQEHKLYVEASPQFKAIIAYDQNWVRSQIHAAASPEQTRQQELHSGKAQKPDHKQQQGLSLS
ncbi:hypothetical protein ACWKW6_30190 [Dyadobacter jiangsuensis]